MSHSLRSDDDLTRAAFLCRTAATASSPIHPPRLYSRPVSPSPSMADESDPSLRSTSRRKTTSLRGEESCPLSRAKLERVLRNGRVVEGRSRSREPRRRDSDSSSAGWPWSDIHSGTATKRPKSSTSSESSHCPKEYFHQHTSSPCHTTLARSRSKTDSALPQHHHRTTTYSPSMLPKSLPSSRAHPTPKRNDSSGSGTTAFTPPLTADASPLFNNNHQHEHQLPCVDPDDMRLLTPPPTPPLLASPYMHSHKRREIDVGSVERLDLTLATVRTTPASTRTRTNTFNARKASETCRRMEGYVSFAAVEGLGMPPNGVDDDENDGCGDDARADDLKRGSNIIGTWARKLFVGIATNHPSVAAAPTNSNPTTTSVA
ncbi:hypothetical protein AGABI1DRAFT_116317 [Agaricus bisporus var. burnettii JB137-S8]|uniref:Uncharacterized protein n=1 Tax=Agaricus bisporus var. burnettii (strain JB137-S8 / ATCC MYA-4627 / FGSC 10392) TaxID=597362 RepID=K5WXT6_AGABU|nr:uncharacterized protein AGABI1DRAFT_116317 [Agaricus bisporus var. burnettii JB137-S8]EKM75608.1 hypothetical protein AGABI1DRAFT_116317 [Agaricus bisporus var. burnettii JB137-S8]